MIILGLLAVRWIDETLVILACNQNVFDLALMYCMLPLLTVVCDEAINNWILDNECVLNR